MDDQRDYEEERARGAALREEQEAEAAGLETLGNTDPVDSSSPDYEPPVEATVDAEETPQEPQSFTLAQIAEKEGQSFAEVLDEIYSLCRFGARTAFEMQTVYDHGLDPAPDSVQIEMTALESQALSVGLNLVTLFEPGLAPYAESLLRRAAETVRARELDEERAAEIKRHMRELIEEQEAALFGFESLEEYREAKAQAEAELAAAQTGAIDRKIDPEKGAHLN